MGLVERVMLGMDDGDGFRVGEGSVTGIIKFSVPKTLFFLSKYAKALGISDDHMENEINAIPITIIIFFKISLHFYYQSWLYIKLPI